MWGLFINKDELRLGSMKKHLHMLWDVLIQGYSMGKCKKDVTPVC